MKTCPRIRDRGRTLGLFSLSRIFRGRSSDIFDWSKKEEEERNCISEIVVLGSWMYKILL